MPRPQYNVRFTEDDRERLERLRALKLTLEGISLSTADLVRAGLVALEREYAQQAKRSRAIPARPESPPATPLDADSRPAVNSDT